MHTFDIADGDYDETYENGSTEFIDVSFRKINKNFTAFLIWKVENLTLVPLPKEQYGTFYDHDSYIIYAASAYGQPISCNEIYRELRSGLEYHIHFWLGKYTTPDKSGVAAYKTVELDSFLDCETTQHREVQGNDSPRFKSYFKDGIRIINGGTAFGFNIVQDTFEPKLYKVKGRRAPTVIQMPDIAWSHFNSADIFMLHTKETLYIWLGRAANPVEKLHATKAAMQLRTECKIPDIVFVDDGYEKTLPDSIKRDFENYLPLHERIVMPAHEAEDEEIAESKLRSTIRLYRCSDNNGKYRVTEIKSGPLKQEDLDMNDVFILDHGRTGIWVWVGKRASEKERFEAMRNARGYVKKKKYPQCTAVTRVVDGAEPSEFKMLFFNWRVKVDTKGLGKPYIPNQLNVAKVNKFDVATMHERPALAAQAQLIDDGSGIIKKWRVRHLEIIQNCKETFNVFFDSDCYIFLYNYEGQHSSQEERDTAVLKISEVDTGLQGKAFQVRVVQGHEPAHFLQMFNGKMTIFTGKGTDYDNTGRNLTVSNYYLCQVQGSVSYNTKAVQVPLKAGSLNSNYCFIMRKNNLYYLWCGRNSNGDNREMAKGFAGIDFALIMERAETLDFWSTIGKKGNYVTNKIIPVITELMPARLFQCSTASGIFKAEEIFNFIQMDLAPEDVMLLDTTNAIFLWIGNHSTKEEQQLSLQKAIDFLKADPAGRSIDTPIIEIRQGCEPPIFTGFFATWDNTIWKDCQSYEQLRDEIEKKNTNLHNKITLTGVKGDTDFDRHHKYPVALLKSSNEKLPASVDPLRKELHLTHDDFVTLFNMNYKEFEGLPLWKQKELKKSVGLF